MNKLFGANVCRFLNCFFLKAKLKVDLFARVGDYRPCLRFHCLCYARWQQSKLASARRFNYNQLHSATVMKSMTRFQFRGCAKMTSP